LYIFIVDAMRGTYSTCLTLLVLISLIILEGKRYKVIHCVIFTFLLLLPVPY